MVSEEGESPWRVEGRRAEEPEIIRVFVEDFFAVDQLAEKGVCEGASQGFFVARGGKGRLEDAVDQFLRLCIGFVEADAACRGISK